VTGRLGPSSFGDGWLGVGARHDQRYVTSRVAFAVLLLHPGLGPRSEPKVEPESVVEVSHEGRGNHPDFGTDTLDSDGSYLFGLGL
jgi:hypothetical protein